MTTTPKDTLAVIEQLVGALEQSTHELKFGNPRTTATDTYRYSNTLIHECDAALTAGREALETQGEAVDCAYYSSQGACCESGEPCKADRHNAALASHQVSEPQFPDCWVVVKDGQIIGTHDEPCHLHGIEAVRYVPASTALPALHIQTLATDEGHKDL